MNGEKSILFLGDVLPYKPFRFRNNLKTVINLECPITSSFKPVSGKISLGIMENHLSEIFGQNLLAVNLSNNHILDYGLEGLHTTASQVEKTGASYFGISYPSGQDHNPLVLNHGDRKIAFLSAVSERTAPIVEFDDFNYLLMLDHEKTASAIKAAKANADRLIVYLHTGIPESSYPARGEIITARSLVDAGADVVVGCHSHAPQAIERYKNGIIAYNLGNFIMPSFRNTPSFYDEEGRPLSSFSKRLMPWNRISWGLAVDMESLEHEVRKYFFLADFIVQVRSTPLDRYLELNERFMEESYKAKIVKHLRSRKFSRNIVNLVNSPFGRYL